RRHTRSKRDWSSDVCSSDLPLVPLLPPEELEGAETRMIGSSAVTPIVLMIGDQMRVHTGLGEHLWHRIVERLQRAPTTVQEVVAPGMQFPAGRHARHRAAVA